jgi:6-phospho-beta-glucosidase
VKLAIVGGGSTYTPELVDGLIRLRDVLPVAELALVDPDARRRELVGGVARRMLGRAGHPAELTVTGEVAATEGADAVLFQLRVGGQAARHLDETLPLPYGLVGQETTGAGGLAKALRTVPVVLELAAEVARRAPDAWIVDFTNPVGIVTRALLDAGHRAIGLCNVAIGFQRRFAARLGVPPSRVALDQIGLNHLTWLRAVRVGGADVLPSILAESGEEVAGELGLPAHLVRRLGVVPSYYLRYYYAHDAVVRELTGAPTRAEKVAEIEAELLDMYADPALDTKPELLEHRGGAFYSEAAVELLAALLRDPAAVGAGVPREQVLNVRNRGTLPFLADDAVIEAPCAVGRDGAAPLPADPVPPLFAGLIAHVSAYEEVALDACLRGGHDRVAGALLAHPLIGQADVAARLAADIIAAGRAYLPWARP